MKNKIIKLFFLLFSAILILSSGKNLLAANLSDAFKKPLEDFSDQAGYQNKNVNIELFIAKIIQTILSFLGVIFLILMLYGGYLWMTDRGNADRMAKAQKVMEAAVIGLIIVVGAYAISYFVVNALSKDLLT